MEKKCEFCSEYCILASEDLPGHLMKIMFFSYVSTFIQIFNDSC